jgi:hypothetical protein
VTVLVIVVVVLGAWLRGRVSDVGRARGLELSVERARVGWFAAHLRGLRIGLEGVPGLIVELGDVDVDVDVHGRPTKVYVRGGKAHASGDPDVLLEQVRAWRARHAPTQPTQEKGDRPTTAIDASGIAIDAPLPGGGALSAKDVSVEREGADTKLTAAALEASHGDTRATAQKLTVALAGQKLRSALLESLLVELVVRKDANAPTDAAANPEPVLPLLPTVVDKKGRKKVDPTPQEPIRVELPDIAPIRGRAAATARLVAANLLDGAEVAIAALSLQVTQGKEKITLGPGRADLLRTPEHIELKFATDATRSAPGSTPLSARLELPTGGADLRASLSGGPVTFATLGVQEGAFGLIDVARAQLSGKAAIKVDAQGAATFDADLVGRGAGIERAWLSPVAVRGLDVGVRLAGVYESKKRLRVDDAEGALGALRLRFRGTLEAVGESGRLSGSFEVPASACQSLLESVPVGLVPTIGGARLSGTFGAAGRLALDTSALDDLELAYQFDDRCHFVDVPKSIERDHFRKPFMHRIVKPDGSEAEVETGPDSPNWTPIELISPYMQAAVLTTEDGAFFKHHGFNHAAIRNSLVANLKAKRFARGASTISMQLAKNLFLSRSKNISRKLEEVVLTDYLEQTFSKEELMELYLNVIEFGPNIYGITQATEHYYARKPEELNLAESMFLATLLPRPVEVHKMYEKGSISEGWQKNLRTLIEIAFRTGKVSEAERNEGLTQSIAFVKEGDPRPAPRPPVSGAHFGNIDAEWKALE